LIQRKMPVGNDWFITNSESDESRRVMSKWDQELSCVSSCWKFFFFFQRCISISCLTWRIHVSISLSVHRRYSLPIWVDSRYRCNAFWMQALLFPVDSANSVRDPPFRDRNHIVFTLQEDRNLLMKLCRR